ncbi:hypothetical protein [Endothiovibrio diazotrophicus]
MTRFAANPPSMLISMARHHAEAVQEVPMVTGWSDPSTAEGEKMPGARAFSGRSGYSD